MKQSLLHPILVIVFSCISFSCRHSEPNFTYMPDMVNSPALKAQRPGSLRTPVAGTVPQDFQPYLYANDPEQAAQKLKNPHQPTESILKRGEHIYKNFCIVCHGPSGQGDGSIIPKFPKPPTLHSEKVRQWSDARIYHVITAGQNLMPSYASQITASDRWAVIHYLRVMQKKFIQSSQSSLQETH